MATASEIAPPGDAPPPPPGEAPPPPPSVAPPPPPSSGPPPEWEKAKAALAAIQKSKKPEEKTTPAMDDQENNFDRYGGPIGYPPNFNMMGYPGAYPPYPGPEAGYGWNSMPPPPRYGMFGYAPNPPGAGGFRRGGGGGGYGFRPPVPPSPDGPRHRPPPPGGFYVDDDEAGAEMCSSDKAVQELRNRVQGGDGFPTSQFNGPSSFSNQAPGSGGIRFSLPKRNFTPGNNHNPFGQNYGNKRRAQQQMFDAYKNQYRPQNAGSGPTHKGNARGSSSPQRTSGEEEAKRIPSPPPPPTSPKREDSRISVGAGGASPIVGSPGAQQQAQGDWPPSLKEYVSRAFASVTNEHQRDIVQNLLKKKLEDAFKSQRAQAIDWDKEPLPFAGISASSPATSSSSAPLLPFRFGLSPRKASRWGADGAGPGAAGFGVRGDGGRARMSRGRGAGGFQANSRRRSPAGYRRPRSYSRSRSRSRSRSYSRSSRSYSSSRSRSRSRSPKSRGSRKFDRRRLDHPVDYTPTKGRRKFRDLGSESDSDSSPRGSRTPPSQKRRSVVDRNSSLKKGARGRGRGRGKALPDRKDGKKTKKGFSFEYNDPEKTQKMQRRAARFAGQLDNKKPRATPLTLQINQFDEDSNDSEMDWSSAHIVGTCQDLEKGYLRLTTAPTASQIRPLPVLKKALELVTHKWKLNHDYHHTCEQLKSIRQDLTVQNIRSEFTVRVYEIHARIAMEMKDHEEFNQCQTNLKLLYAEGIPGNVTEFTGYRILYYIFTKNTTDMTSALFHLTPEQRDDDVIKHALGMRSAWALNNYKRFYSLYASSPKQSSHLIDWFLERERKGHVKLMMKVYRPTLPVKVVESSLGFASTDECVSYLKDLNFVLSPDGAKIDPKSKENNEALAAL